jgi:metal-dependent amidase/aminoacylase/carboxypeptidase family protein
MDELKEKIKEDIYSIKEELFSISKYIHDNPETGRKEYKAVLK